MPITETIPTQYLTRLAFNINMSPLLTRTLHKTYLDLVLNDLFYILTIVFTNKVQFGYGVFCLAYNSTDLLNNVESSILANCPLDFKPFFINATWTVQSTFFLFRNE